MTYKEFIDGIVAERGNHSNYNKKVKGYEIHHITPRCMGGSDKEDNLVALTIPEHLMAHTLLFRENQSNKKFLVALYHMANVIGVQELMKVVDNKEDFYLLSQNICKARELYNISGENNPMYNKHHSEELKQKLSKERTGKGNPRAKKVYCPELDMTFDTIKEALVYVGIKSGILQCCKHQFNRKTAGRHPVTNEKLHWSYIE